MPNPKYFLEPYHEAIRNELSSYGVSVEIDTKDKSWVTPIRSAFNKTNTLGDLLKIRIPRNLVRGLHPEMLLLCTLIKGLPIGSAEIESSNRHVVQIWRFEPRKKFSLT